ncbi:MAG: hypothetical protein U5K43_12645 [Halofilum sp. (in: g-proteobacteria)]|nr:hypothetical protein [Halofilum sp. (in: g-proteobacteria)]
MAWTYIDDPAQRRQPDSTAAGCAREILPALRGALAARSTATLAARGRCRPPSAADGRRRAGGRGRLVRLLAAASSGTLELRGAGGPAGARASARCCAGGCARAGLPRPPAARLAEPARSAGDGRADAPAAGVAWPGGEVRAWNGLRLGACDRSRRSRWGCYPASISRRAGAARAPGAAGRARRGVSTRPPRRAVDG